MTKKLPTNQQMRRRGNGKEFGETLDDAEECGVKVRHEQEAVVY
jgi:hypothetical protein